MHTHKINGFTLVETIVALSLSVLIILSATQIFIQGLSHIKGVRAEALLTSDVGYMVQMIRSELLGAEDIVVNPSNPSEVRIIRPDGTTVFSLTDGRLAEDGSPVTRDGVTVTALTFTRVGDSLNMQLTLWSGARTDKTFTGQTTLALRS